MRSEMEYIISLGVRDQRVGSALQEQADGIVVTPLGSPHCRRRIGFASSGIDVRSRVHEVLAERIMVVDRCPLDTPLY